MKYVRVKNFERFQHYKDRSPPWIKLYNDLLDDYEFACLQDASKLHLVMIWLLASRNDNRLPADPAWIARRINATEPVDVNGLIDKGFLVMEHNASNMLAECKQVACPERETETEKNHVHFDPLNGFAQWYAGYPRKEAKPHAEKAWRKLNAADRTAALEALDTWPFPADKKFTPLPASWLNARRWEDEREEADSWMPS